MGDVTVGHVGEYSSGEKNIVFIGFMGVGKTTVGQLVAKKLRRDFIDTDQEIEAKTGMSITEIFEKHGEDYFRTMERKIIKKIILEQRLKVISLGGGAFLQKEIRDVCLKHCIVFFLDLDWSSWLERLEKLKEDRPILKNKKLEEIKKLYQQRYPVYSLSHLRIQIEDHTPDHIAAYIVECLKHGWQQ